MEEQTIPALIQFTKEIHASVADRNNYKTAENIYWIAECFFQLRALNELESVYKKCDSFVQHNNPEAGIQLNTTYGKLLIEKGSYEDCIQHLTKLITTTNDKKLLCDIYLILADAYQRLQQTNKSIICFQYVIKNATIDIQKAKAYNGIGSYYILLSQLDSAQIAYKNGISFLQKSVGLKHSLYAQICYNMGIIADRKSDYYNAEKYFSTALDIYKIRAGENHPKTANAYGALGSLYLLEDNPEKALYYSLKERNILLSLHNDKHPDLIYSLLNCGKIYFLLGNKLESEKVLSQAIRIIETHFGKQHNLYKQCIVELAETYIAQKKMNAAALLLAQAKQLAEDEYSGDIYMQSGDNYLVQKVYQHAIVDYQKSIALFEAYYGKKNTYALNAYIGLSNAYLQNAQLEKALQIADNALQITLQNNKVILPYDNWICLVQKARCKKALFQKNTPNETLLKQEIYHLKQAIAIANKIKHTLYTSGSQAYFADKMTELNQLGIYFLANWYPKRDSYFYDNLFYFTENNKANLLRNKIVTYQSNEILPKVEKEQAHYITSQLNYFTLLKENSEKNIPSIDDSILFYTTQFEQFTQHIEQKYPKIFYLKFGNKSITTNKIQQALNANTSFIEYIQDGENYYYIHTKKSALSFNKCGKIPTIDSMVNHLQQSIIHKKYNIHLANQISTLLLPNNLETQLIIAPAANLYAAPFDALTQQNKYLIEKYNIQYTFSANTYFRNRMPIENKNVIAIFPSYKGTAFPELNITKEQESLQKFSDFQVFKNVVTNHATILQKPIVSGIVHVGAHLAIDTLQPMQSAIVIHPKNKQQLTLDEIWKLNLNAQLVTLAACQSNFGVQQSSEGLKNFAWAFHYAGARNILSTQWNASDKSTAIIIDNFYENLRNGQSKAEALRSAKLNYLKSADAIGIQPFYWSNFYLYGDDTDIALKTPFLVKFWWMPIFFLIMCYIGISFVRKHYVKKQYDHI